MRQHGQVIRREFLISINQGHIPQAAFIMFWCPVRGSRISQYITAGHRPGTQLDKKQSSSRSSELTQPKISVKARHVPWGITIRVKSGDVFAFFMYCLRRERVSQSSSSCLSKLESLLYIVTVNLILVNTEDDW